MSAVAFLDYFSICRDLVAIVVANEFIDHQDRII